MKFFTIVCAALQYLTVSCDAKGEVLGGKVPVPYVAGNWYLLVQTGFKDFFLNVPYGTSVLTVKQMIINDARSNVDTLTWSNIFMASTTSSWCNLVNNTLTYDYYVESCNLTKIPGDPQWVYYVLPK